MTATAKAHAVVKHNEKADKEIDAKLAPKAKPSKEEMREKAKKLASALKDKDAKKPEPTKPAPKAEEKDAPKDEPKSNILRTSLYASAKETERLTGLGIATGELAKDPADMRFTVRVGALRTRWSHSDMAKQVAQGVADHMEKTIVAKVEAAEKAKDREIAALKKQVAELTAAAAKGAGGKVDASKKPAPKAKPAAKADEDVVDDVE